MKNELQAPPQGGEKLIPKVSKMIPKAMATASEPTDSIKTTFLLFGSEAMVGFTFITF